MSLEYGGFEVIGAEDVHRDMLERARHIQRPDVSQAIKEKQEVIMATSRWSPREVRVGSEMPKLEARLSRASALIIVMPPRHTMLAVEASKEMEDLLEWAEGAESKAILVYYSRKGIMTTAAYLYLGNVMEEADVGILFVNGPPSEVAEVFSTLESRGEYTPAEGGYIDINF